MPIRPATIDDADALLPLVRAYCDFYESSPSEAGLREFIEAMIEAPEDEAFVLVAEDVPGSGAVGFAACNWKWSSLRGARIVFLDDLFVGDGSRRAGHGRALIDRIAEISRAGGGTAVEWLTQPHNSRARSVYDATGAGHEDLIEYELNLP